MRKKPQPAHDGQQRRQRVQPHLKGQPLRGPAPPQQHDTHGLAYELDDQPHRQHRGDHHLQLELRRKRAVKFYGEGSYDEMRMLLLLTWQTTEYARLHNEIEHSNSRNRNENAAWNVFLRLANLAAEVTDVVIAPVGVNRVDRG